MYIKEVYIKDVNETDYATKLLVNNNITNISFENNVTFITGENGVGKSTLIEAIAINYGFNPEGGSKNFRFSSYDTHSNLASNITLVKNAITPNDGYFLRAESFYNVISKINEYGDGLESSYGGVDMHQISHGQSFLNLVKERFFSQGLYILDEPEAALSPTSQFAMLYLINQLSHNSQFIIVTHSPILIGLENATILEMNSNGIEKVDFKDSYLVNLYQRYLNDANYRKQIIEE